MSNTPTPCTNAEIRRLQHRHNRIPVDDMIEWAMMLERSREDAYKERDQLKLDCITLAEELAEAKQEYTDQADALAEIHEAEHGQCVYDNPKSMRREHYRGGSLMWSISAVALAGALFEPESHWDRLEWKSGTFHLGDRTDLPNE